MCDIMFSSTFMRLIIVSRSTLCAPQRSYWCCGHIVKTPCCRALVPIITSCIGLPFPNVSRKYCIFIHNLYIPVYVIVYIIKSCVYIIYINYRTIVNCDYNFLVFAAQKKTEISASRLNFLKKPIVG